MLKWLLARYNLKETVASQHKTIVELTTKLNEAQNMSKRWESSYNRWDSKNAQDATRFMMRCETLETIRDARETDIDHLSKLVDRLKAEKFILLKKLAFKDSDPEVMEPLV